MTTSGPGRSTSSGGGEAGSRRRAARAAPAAPTRRAGTGADRADPGTRQKVIDAAIRCILEQGFYRASSNAIAEAAGLSWGVIQYYFGTRESLMLAVLDEGIRRLTDVLSRAELTGESLAERVEEYFTVLESHYADPDYLAFIQVLLNLSHDPRTSEQTRRYMVDSSEAINGQLTRLTSELFAGTGVRRRVVRSFPFYVLRGMALSEVMLTTLPFDTTAMQRNVSAQRRLLTDAVTLLLEAETGASGRLDG